jgi:hypothetical protein
VPSGPAELVYFPVGRYAFAGFVPTVVLLVLGLGALLPRRWHPLLCLALTLLWVALDAAALVTSLEAYYTSL